MRLPLATLLFLLAACVTPAVKEEGAGDPASTTPEQEQLPEPPATKPPATGVEFDRRVASILEQIEAHDYDRALGQIGEVLALRPPPDLRAYIEGLRAGLKRDLLQSLYVDAFIVLDKKRIALGTPITGQIIIVNLSTQPLSIPARVGGNATTIQLDLQYKEFEVGGMVLTKRKQQPVLVGQDILLQPGERHAEPILLDSLALGANRPSYRRYDVEAIMYPSAIIIGTDNWPGNLRLRSARCEVFPRNYEHLMDRPVSRLQEAVAKNSPAHIPLAAALVSPSMRGQAVDQLINTLRSPWGQGPDGPTRVACCVGLRILTGEEITARPQAWLAWAEQRR